MGNAGQQAIGSQYASLITPSPPGVFIPGLFGELVARVWRVTGMAVHDTSGSQDNPQFLIYVTPADENADYGMGGMPVSQKVFAVTPSEYDELDRGDLVHLTLSW